MQQNNDFWILSVFHLNKGKDAPNVWLSINSLLKIKILLIYTS